MTATLAPTSPSAAKFVAKAVRTDSNRGSHVPWIVGLLIVADRIGRTLRGVDSPVGVAMARPYTPVTMSKKTKRKKAKMRRSKANHGKRPNMGR